MEHITGLLVHKLVRSGSDRNGDHVLLVAADRHDRPVNLILQYQIVPELMTLLTAAAGQASKKRIARFGSAAAADKALGLYSAEVKSIDLSLSPKRDTKSVLMSVRLSNGISYDLTLPADVASKLADGLSQALKGQVQSSQG
jgi:hypothetical protein